MEMRLLTNMIIFLSAEAQVAVHMYSFVIISFSTIVSQRNSWQGKHRMKIVRFSSLHVLMRG